jgi:hypothetical protein
VSEPRALPALNVARKTGNEPFVAGGAPLDFHLIDFWQWAASDLTSNALRGVLAEYLVARALGAHNGTRTAWDSCDLRTENFAVEVKSAAYLQTWFQTKRSKISFDIGPKRGWDATTNVTGTVPERAADLYVFALLHHQDKPTLDTLNTDQWTFFVLAKAVLDRSVAKQKKIGLNRLKNLGPKETDYVGLAHEVEACRAGS